MKEFITYDMLLVYATFIMVLFMIVEFVKELKVLKGLKTKYLAFFIACAMVILIYAYVFIGSLLSIEFLIYIVLRIPLILINAVVATFATNGVSDFNNPVDKTKKQI